MTSFMGEGWYDSNQDRSYPLVDHATRVATTSELLANDVIVDARLAAPPSYPATSFYVREIRPFGAGAVLTVAVDGIGDVASVTVPFSTFSEFTAYTLAPLPGHPSIGGTIVLGRGILAIPATLTFVLLATQLLPTVIFPAAPAVSSITVVDAFGGEIRLTGAVTLVAGDNAAVAVSGQDVEFTMETGVLLEDPCACTDAGGIKRTAIKSINGVVPDAAGNLTIQGVGCAQVSSAQNGLKLADSCAQPCCGTPEIELLQNSARDLQLYLASLGTKSAELEAALRAIETHLAG